MEGRKKIVAGVAYTLRAAAVVAFLLGVLDVGALPGQETAGLAREGQELRGCYRVQVGEWTERPGGDPPGYSPPDTVRLTLEPVGGGFWRLAPGVAEVGEHTPRWGVVKSDSVRLTWYNGYYGLEMSIPLAGHTLGQGVVRPKGHGIIIDRDEDGTVRVVPTSYAPAWLRRVECKRAKKRRSAAEVRKGLDQHSFR